MEFAIQIADWCVGLPLEVLIISELLRGLWRRYLFLFAYVVALFLATAIEIPVYVAYYTGNHQAFRSRAWTYWLDEVVLLARRVFRFGLIVGSVAGMAISGWLRYEPRAASAGPFMTAWTGDLYFGAAALDLALWALLIASREKDHRLLLLSGGLGIQFTGEAIGTSIVQLALRNRSRTLSLSGGVVMVLADLMFLYIWWQAFRMEPARRNHRVTVSVSRSSSSLP